MNYQPKDFVETRQGLIFAVMDFDREDDHVLCFLRYLRKLKGFQKLSTEDANQLLRDRFPKFLFYSKRCDAQLHGVASGEITQHFRPRQRINDLKSTPARDSLEQCATEIVEIFSDAGLSPENLGITGSILIAAQSAGSDIDLVVYGRDNFALARKIISESIDAGRFQQLNTNQWQDAYARRAPSITQKEYIWHEQRKFNKAMYHNIKFDISLLDDSGRMSGQRSRKIGRSIIDAVVSCDRYAFDYPARYQLDHDDIVEAISFTPTYAGQAFMGETIKVSGNVESSINDRRRIVVGSTREAPGEYIKVISTDRASVL